MTTSTRIRKNASLKALAQEAVDRCNRAYRQWARACDEHRNCPWRGEYREATRRNVDAKWAVYYELRDLAAGLARHAGIDGPKSPGDPE